MDQKSREIELLQERIRLLEAKEQRLITGDTDIREHIERLKQKLKLIQEWIS